MIGNLGKIDTEPPDSVLELQGVSFSPYEVHSGSSPKPDSAHVLWSKSTGVCFFLFFPTHLPCLL